MQRKREEGFASNKLVKESDQANCCLLLDLNYSSNLLSTKIADIPHKLKYETILAPIFEYCFGTSDQDLVWEHFTNTEIICYINGDYFTEPNNNSSLSIINLKIDWIRDKPYIYSQIFNLVKRKLDILARKLGLWNNRVFVFNCIYNGLNTFEYNYEFCRNDRELMMAAVKENGTDLKFASEELKHDKEIVMQAVKQNAQALEFASDQYSLFDEELDRCAIVQQSCGSFYATKNDREFVMNAILFNVNNFNVNIFDTFPEYRNDKEIVMLAMQQNPYTLLSLSDEFDELKKEIVMQASQQHCHVFQHASEELKNNREFVKETVKINGECLQFVSKQFQDDLEIVELALKSSPNAIHYISDRLRKDTEFISKLIGKRGFSSRLPVEFSSDREIVLESIKLYPNALKLAAPELQNDREFILHVVKNCGIALEYVANQFKSDREIIITAITQNGNALEFAPDEYYHDKNIILKAAETATPLFNENFYAKLSEPLQNDRELLMKCSMFFEYFPRRYQLDREFIMQALKSAPEQVIQNVYPLFVNDRVLAMKIVKQDGLLLRELPSKYRNDREIVSFAIQQNKKAIKFA